MTALAALNEAREHGLFVAARGDQLAVKPTRLLTPDFAAKLLEYKPQLVSLLKLKDKTWIEVYSQRLGGTVFFCQDEDTKASLVAAGASEWSIWTNDELRILVAQNRIAPLTNQELRTLHSIKSAFNARVTE